MPSAPPTVSVVMPAYNVAAFIDDAIRSVRGQTFEDFELLVIDDGSGDETRSIVQRHLDDPRIRLIEQPNRGLAGARNTGILAARGRYVALLDSDDRWRPSKLAHHVSHLEANPDVGVSFDPAAFIDEHGVPLGLVQTPRLTDITVDHILKRNPVGNGSAAVIRRAALDAIAFRPLEGPGSDRLCFFDESFRQSEDIECWVRMALTTPWRFQGLDRVLTEYRVGDHGLSANIERQFESWRRMRDKMAQLDPDIVRRHGRAAEAYQCRYLARRAVRARDAGTALRLMGRAWRVGPGALLAEPKRTLITQGAALVLWLLPRAVFTGLEAVALKAIGRARARRGQAPAEGSVATVSGETRG
ncbi:glycosyltransferase family 2 protein [Roseospira visakhapatnamensis]|uniref:Glycosyltransferase involved in cell wall biosynthesis n=1 Tax=Roseospira visakhapatnamensis TaxID=390880 RepID=A0A7W6RC99_9PROT|nr:glycosyltransferase [Roseospira visakhapatnamensis]MBB4265288.1 glycosyltransferase involved in cell wall biosynthesis [Roseospira visakhapatnamensis]